MVIGDYCLVAEVLFVASFDALGGIAFRLWDINGHQRTREV